MKKIGIIKLYCGKSGEIGFYNSQEIGEAKSFIKFGYKPYVFICDLKTDETYEEIINGISVIHCVSKSIGVHGKFKWSIIEKYDLDFVQINGDNQVFACDLANFCRTNNIKYYFYIGTIEVHSKNIIKKFISKQLIKRNIKQYRKSICFAKSDYVLNQLKSFGVEHVKTAPVGLDNSVIPLIETDCELIKQDLKLPINKKIVLFVGRMENYKNPLLLIDIMQNLGEECFFVVIGDGSLTSRFDYEIEKKNLNDKVLHINRIENSSIHKYYYVSDYFVNLNENEIFGMSILEAMYQGCNVIALKAPGPNMIIENNINGFLVENLDDIYAIIDDDKKCKKENIRNRIKNKFIWDSTIGEIINIIDE